MKKKLVFTLLTLALALSCAFGMVACGSSSPITYEPSEDGSYYIVTKIELKASGDLEIPSEYNGKPVKRVKYSAAGHSYSYTDNTSKINHLTLPNSINYIDSEAFKGIQQVTFGDYSNAELTTHDENIQPYSLYVGRKAFAYYRGTSIELPANVYLGETVFERSELTEVKFKGNIAVNTDGKYELKAFVDTLKLASLELPEATAEYSARLYDLTVNDERNIQGGSVTSAYSLPLKYVVIPDCVNLKGESWRGYFGSSMYCYPPKLYFKINANTPASILSRGIDLDWRVLQPGHDETKLSAFVYYYSEEQPATKDAKVWHYVNGSPVEW